MGKMGKKLILITGGAGFIGSHTADALLSRGYGIRVLDCLDPQIHGAQWKPPAYLDPRIELLVGDVRNREDVVSALAGVDAVLHFAAQTGVGQSMYDIHSYCDVNISGTAMLLDVLANTEHRVEKIVLSSSRAVYGEGSGHCTVCGVVHPSARSRGQLEAKKWSVTCPTCGSTVTSIPTEENRPLAPISVYALTKKVQEEMLRLYAETYGVPFVILRYFNVYGPRQALRNPYTGIGAIFVNRALAGCDIPIYEDGNAGRDFVHVRDVVQANLLALENERAENGTFNVGTGDRLTVMDLAFLIREKTGTPISIEVTGQCRIGDIRDCYADLTHSKALLGYAPKVSFAEGVEDLIAWARGEQAVDSLDAAEEELRTRGLMRKGGG